jgi:hypothetical protein
MQLILYSPEGAKDGIWVPLLNANNGKQKYTHYKCECRVILVKINEDQLGKKPRRVKPGGAGRPGGDVINFIQP